MKIDIHDFEITAIVATGADAFDIRLIDPQGSGAYTMKFKNVKQLFVDGFSLQNIVLDISVFTQLREDFGFRRASGMLDLKPEAVESAISGGALILIEASSGAEVACLLDSAMLPQLVRDGSGVALDYSHRQ